MSDSKTLYCNVSFCHFLSASSLDTVLQYIQYSTTCEVPIIPIYLLYPPFKGREVLLALSVSHTVQNKNQIQLLTRERELQRCLNQMFNVKEQLSKRCRERSATEDTTQSALLRHVCGCCSRSPRLPPPPPAAPVDQGRTLKRVDGLVCHLFPPKASVCGVYIYLYLSKCLALGEEKKKGMAT